MPETIKVLVISDFDSAIHTIKLEGEILIRLVELGMEVVLMTIAEAQYIPRFEDNGVRVTRFYP